MSFPRYPEYKDSGAEWLGETPKHWGVAALKYLVSMKSGGTPSKDNLDYWDGDIPWASAKDLKVDYLSDTADHITQDAVDAGASLVPAGSLLVVVRGMILAKIFPVVQATTPMAINQDLKALQPKPGIDSRYLSWLLRGAEKESMRRTDEAGHGTKALRMDIWSAMPLPVPPVDEQCVIATFLDRETAKLNELMAEQEKLIALLKEKRQAVIAHAVTKGLDPIVPMKDSGVEWLGEVPTHWTVISLGRATQEKCDGPFGSGLKSEHYKESGVRVIRLQNIRQDGFDGSDEAFIDAEYYQSALAGRDVVAGDVLIAGLGDERNTVGRACVAPDDIAPAMVKADCFRFRLFTEIAVPAFVARQLSVSSSADAGAFATGTTRSRIPLTVMATRKVSLPPAKEQQEIVSWIEQEMVKLDALCAECEQAIELLKERRTALISAAVTGQIDVRGPVKDEQEQAA